MVELNQDLDCAKGTIVPLRCIALVGCVIEAIVDVPSQQLYQYSSSSLDMASRVSLRDARDIAVWIGIDTTGRQSDAPPGLSFYEIQL